MGVDSRWLGVALVTAALAGCSSGSPLTTSALLGTGGKAPLDEPSERALKVAATSARATRCGYVFDPAKLRATYLAYETAQGTSADQVAKLEKSYDFTAASVSKRITKAEEYCNDDKTREIKRDLTRHLAGDFALPAKPVVPVKATRWWESDEPTKPMDREAIFNPQAPR